MRVEADRMEAEIKRLREAADMLDPRQPIPADPLDLNKISRLIREPLERMKSSKELAIDALKASGRPMTREELWAYAQSRNSKITSRDGFGVALSSNSETFQFKDGKWSLVD